MKKIILLLTVLVMSCCVTAQPVYNPATRYVGDTVNKSSGGWTQLTKCDDCYEVVNLPFAYYFGNNAYTTVYISNNGAISFGTGVTSYIPNAFPSVLYLPIIAPLWCDVDTRSTTPASDSVTNRVWYKVYNNRLVVIWDSVGYYNFRVDKRNKFQLQLGDNSGIRKDGLFAYDMAMTYDTVTWLRGDANSATDFPVMGFDAADGILYYNQTGSRSASVLDPANQHVSRIFNMNQNAMAIPPKLLPTINYKDSTLLFVGLSSFIPSHYAYTGPSIFDSLYAVRTFSATGSPGKPFTFNRPIGIAADQNGTVYVNDYGSSRLLYASDTSTTFRLMAARDSSVVSLTADPAGSIYSVNSIQGTVTRRRLSDTSVRFKHGQIPGYTYRQPSAVAVDKAGNVYVADKQNNRIAFSTPSGNALTIAMKAMKPFFAGSISGVPGRVNGKDSFASFNQPAGLAFDTSGNLIVADQGNNQIRKITPEGIVSLLAGDAAGTAGTADGTGPAARFNRPFAVCIDALNNIYITDQGNNKVRKITPDGIVTTIAGKGTPGYRDGRGDSATFNGLGGIAYDYRGFLYVADTGNNAIRTLNLNSVTVTPALPAGLLLNGIGNITGSPYTPTGPVKYLVTIQFGSYVIKDSVVIAIAQVLPFSKSILCRGESDTMRVLPAAAGLSWKWRTTSCTGPVQASGDMAVVTPSDTTTYYLSADGFSECRPLRIPVVQLLDRTPGTVSGLCAGSVVTFTVPAKAPATYQWWAGSTAISGATANSYTYAQNAGTPTAYRLVALQAGTGCTDTSGLKTVSGIIAPVALPAVTATQSMLQADGLNCIYSTSDCKAIAGLSDTVGGNILGNTATWVRIDDSVRTQNGQPYLQRHYDITPASNGAATVTLYALQSEFTAYNAYVSSRGLAVALMPTGPADVAGLANISITQYHSLPAADTTGPGKEYDATKWQLIPNSSITKTWNGNYWVLSFPVTGFSGFFISTGPMFSLPVSLMGISARNTGSTNELSWQTATEDAGDYFDVERSFDARIFTRIATVTGQHISGGAYQLTDERPFSGINYYRLKMNGIDGKSSYSRTVTATVEQGSFAMNVFPNPVKDVLSIHLNGITDPEGVLTVTDISGRVILRQFLQGNSSDAYINMSGLEAGIYLLQYKDSNNKKISKITKQ